MKMEMSQPGLTAHRSSCGLFIYLFLQSALQKFNRKGMTKDEMREARKNWERDGFFFFLLFFFPSIVFMCIGSL